MDNIFDGLKTQTFDVIATNMGYDAVWNNITTTVLFNSPSEDEKVGDHDYDFDRPTLEYKVGDWPGMKEQIEAKANVLITVRGKDYYALKILGAEKIAHDGETYKVILQEDV